MASGKPDPSSLLRARMRWRLTSSNLEAHRAPRVTRCGVSSTDSKCGTPAMGDRAASGTIVDMVKPGPHMHMAMCNEDLVPDCVCTLSLSTITKH